MGIGEMNKEINDFFENNGLFYLPQSKQLCRYAGTYGTSVSSGYYEVVASHQETIGDALKTALSMYKSFNLDKAKQIVKMHEIADNSE